ncbi:MAG TPA: Npt1/Npt2 family nucleotide transporter [Polyangiaceae bacterium]
MHALLARFFDVRAGERKQTLRAFVLSLLIIAGHTMLETARDALFLSHLPARQLNLVYVALAALTFFATAASTWAATLIGRRRALVATLAVVSVGTFAARYFTPNGAFAIVLYLYSGLIGAVVIPQFWLLAAHVFSVSQGRRLFGLLAAGGVVGGVVGAGIAAVTVSASDVRSLFAVSSALFLLAIGAAMLVDGSAAGGTSLLGPVDGSAAGGTSLLGPVDTKLEPPASMSRAVVQNDSLLKRIALLVMVSTATVLVADYLFKSAAAHAMPAAKLGLFFARFYAVMNAVSLAVQLIVASRVLRRIGVVGAAAYTPMLLVLGGLGVVTTGWFGAVAIVKAIDGGLRYSLNKIATELLYLPVPHEARERGKAFIDGVLSRVAQAATAIALYLLAVRHLAHPRPLAAILIALAVLWIACVVMLRGKYLELFRAALAVGDLPESAELDLASAETLVEGLASRNPETVMAAMQLLAQKNHGKLIPALVLYHESDAVLAKALDLFSATDRTDWIPLAERLLESPHETVRVAAIRALSRRGVTSAIQAATEDNSSRMQTYASAQILIHEGTIDLMDEPLIATLFRTPGEYGVAARIEILSAIADSPTPRAATALLALARDPEVMETSGATLQLARAMRDIGDPRFVPALIERLGTTLWRDAAREALVQIGAPAFEAIVKALHDPSTEEHLRVHLPRTIGAFGTQRACDVLTDQLERERNGLVRYKVLRGLNMLISAHVRFDRQRLEIECRRNLLEHLRLVTFRVALGSRAPIGFVQPGEPFELLTGLLDDKIVQALERAFRLLKLMYIDEDLHRVYVIARTGERVARTNALEYLDALLAGPRLEATRDLLRIVLDDTGDEERARRARDVVPVAPKNAEEAVVRLIDDSDDLVAMLAARYASSLESASLTAAATRAMERPAIARLGTAWFGPTGSP